VGRDHRLRARRWSWAASRRRWCSPTPTSPGLGRENGVHAMDEYLVDKAVRVELTGGTRDPFTLG
jgi:hypothetical protein